MSVLVAVLVASLLGSVHCAGMCGGFVCFAAGTGGRARPHAAYHAGRLVSYLALGALAGALGSGVDRLGALANVGRAAAVLAGGLMVAWGGATILASLGARIPRPAPPAWAQRRLGGALHALRAHPPSVRAGATGLLTTLLPCGWLYAFVATAGGTGGVGSAMLVMLAFWAGTLPVLAALGAGAQRLAGPFRRRLPVLSAAVVVAVGLLSIAGKMTPRLAPHAPAIEAHAAEHAHGDR